MSEQSNNLPTVPLIYRDSNGVIRPAVTPEEQEMAREQIRNFQENSRINPNVRPNPQPTPINTSSQIVPLRPMNTNTNSQPTPINVNLPVIRQPPTPINTSSQIVPLQPLNPSTNRTPREATTLRPVVPLQPINSTTNRTPQNTTNPVVPLQPINSTTNPVVPLQQPRPKSLIKMTSFTTDINDLHKEHLHDFNEVLSSIPFGEKRGTKTKKIQYHEIYHYKNLPRNYLGIIHNIVDFICKNSNILEISDDPNNIISHYYRENPIISSRAGLTNSMYLNRYFNDISQISNTDVDNFFNNNSIGQQLNRAKIFNKALYDNLLLNSKGLSDEEKRAILLLMDNNIKSGFNFNNNIDCLFNNTYGMLVSLYHTTDFNKNKRQKNPNVIEDFKSKVLVPFKVLQNNINNKLTKYYKLLFDIKHGKKFETNKADLIQKLKNILSLNIASNVNNSLKERLSSFITKELKVDPNTERKYEGEMISIIDYYLNLFKNDKRFGEDFVQFYEKIQNDSQEKMKLEIEGRYGLYIKEFIDSIIEKGKNAEELINFKDKTYKIIEDLVSDGNKDIEDFIESALDYLEDNIASIGFDNFIFNHMAYRCTCLLLMYYFMPNNIINDVHTVDNSIWQGTYYGQNEINSGLMVDFDDSTDVLPKYDDDTNIYKNYMFYNDVFALITLKLLPTLNSVNNVGKAGFKKDLPGNVKNALYIIRPYGHDHTFCLAQCADNGLVYFSDDCSIRSDVLLYLNNTQNLKNISDFPFIYKDFVNELNDNDYRFVGYEKDNNYWFDNYISSKYYKNVVRYRDDNIKKFADDKLKSVISNADFNNTITKQIYQNVPAAKKMKGSGNMNMKEIIIIIISIIAVVIIIGIIILVVKKSNKQTDVDKFRHIK